MFSFCPATTCLVFHIVSDYPLTSVFVDQVSFFVGTVNFLIEINCIHNCHTCLHQSIMLDGKTRMVWLTAEKKMQQKKKLIFVKIKLKWPALVRTIITCSSSSPVQAVFKRISCPVLYTHNRKVHSPEQCKIDAQGAHNCALAQQQGSTQNQCVPHFFSLFCKHMCTVDTTLCLVSAWKRHTSVRHITLGAEIMENRGPIPQNEEITCWTATVEKHPTIIIVDRAWPYSMYCFVWVLWR